MRRINKWRSLGCLLMLCSVVLMSTLIVWAIDGLLKMN